MLSLKIRGNQNFADKISALPRGVRGRACEAAAFALMGNSGNTAKGLQYYPPKPSRSKYVRTYNLRFGWQANKWGDGTKIKIINAVSYAPFVQGDGEQAWFHKGRWRTVSKIISDNKTVIDNAINTEVKKYLKEKGL
jgi:hypothetical protein